MIIHEPTHKKIIRYINYQKIDINLAILYDIKELKILKNSKKKLSNLNFNNLNFNNLNFNQLKRIKKLINIFDNEYYIFILETLPDYIIRNIYRTFSYKWNKIRNEKISNETNIKKIPIILNPIKLKHNIIDITEKNNIKDLLIIELEYIQKNNPNSIKVFISCINDFFI
jgi:hypothetical protein